MASYAVVALPREEEPQIVVPMVDVFVDLPGASPTEVEQRVTRPLEKLLWEVPGVEYLYSTSSEGRSMLVVRFLVGQDEEHALVRLNQKLSAHAAELPPGATPPLVQARSIDDVPVMALTLWGAGYDDAQLRQMAAQLQETLKEVPGIAEVDDHRRTAAGTDRRSRSGGPCRARHRSAPVQQALAGANVRASASDIVSGDRAMRLESGSWPDSIEAVRSSSSAQAGGTPVHLADVADGRGRRRRTDPLRDAPPGAWAGLPRRHPLDREAQRRRTPPH